MVEELLHTGHNFGEEYMLRSSKHRHSKTLTNKENLMYVTTACTDCAFVPEIGCNVLELRSSL